MRKSMTSKKKEQRDWEIKAYYCSDISFIESILSKDSCDEEEKMANLLDGEEEDFVHNTYWKDYLVKILSSLEEEEKEFLTVWSHSKNITEAGKKLSMSVAKAYSYWNNLMKKIKLLKEDNKNG